MAAGLNSADLDNANAAIRLDHDVVTDADASIGVGSDAGTR
jgi:hypothetical protein